MAPVLTEMYGSIDKKQGRDSVSFYRINYDGWIKGILPAIHVHIKVHLLVCKSQETFQAGVSCCCQGLPIPLQPDRLQPRTHRPLWHTHLWYNWHAHLWTHPRLQHGACRSVKTRRQCQQPGCWWQSTKLGVWNHNWRSGMHESLIIKSVKQWRCGCEYSIYMSCLCLALLCMSSFAFDCDLEAFMSALICSTCTCPLLCAAESQGYG